MGRAEARGRWTGFRLPWSARERERVSGAERPVPVDELRDLSETFRWTVARLRSLHQEAEAAHATALRAEEEKKEFYAGVIRAVTEGKLDLLDDEAIPTVGRCVAAIPVRDTAGYAAARKVILETAEAAGMEDERADDLLISAGEAITNAFKHAVNGCCAVYRSEDAVLVRVTDDGAGIRTEDLPNVLLVAGYSTKISLGMGYSLMLRLCDHLWLSTDPSGTVLQLEKKVVAPAPKPLLPSLARM